MAFLAYKMKAEKLIIIFYRMNLQPKTRMRELLKLKDSIGALEKRCKFSTDKSFVY